MVKIVQVFPICTYPRNRGSHPDDPCGATARVKYTKGNDILLRCARHDTEKVREQAKQTGYKRAEL